jgi:hypothetical protein
MKIYTSTIKGYEGECVAIWERTTFDASITSGFFQRVKKTLFGFKIRYGKRFHGYLKPDGQVCSFKDALDFVLPNRTYKPEKYVR